MKKRIPKKNPHAVALGALGGKARMAALSPERRSEIGRAAAEARAASMTPERRAEIARKAGKAAGKAKRKRAKEGGK